MFFVRSAESYLDKTIKIKEMSFWGILLQKD
jgi:hypothetical protein